MDCLPIDSNLPELVAAANRDRRLVVEAAPGAGKTTRLPWALASSPIGDTGEVLVSEPRRLAARLAACRVASERSVHLGERVGYTVRFEDVSGPLTRVRYVTDGVLLRRIVADPTLHGVAAVVLDELHERHLATDVALALLVRSLTTTRPDLVVVAMSATLDAAPVARLLGDCPRHASEGRQYPLTIQHLPKPDDRPLAAQIVSAVKAAVREGPPGDVLVFVPGAAEIRAAVAQLESFAAEASLEILPLHGELTVTEQARAIEPAARRKIVLSTNVAESSVTIDGVTTVVDSGLARMAVHSPWSGVVGLETRKISRASAAQRAGRAGRTAPGFVLRLYTRGDHDTRPAYDPPELLRSDLSETALLLHGAGVAPTEPLAWLDAPPAAALEAAERLLRVLGATTEDGAMTPIGRRMLDLPVAPRLARVLVEGEALGIGALAAEAAAILGEKDPRLDARPRLRGAGVPSRVDGRGDSDVIAIADRLDEMRGAPPRRLRAAGLDPRVVAAIDRTRRVLSRILRAQVPTCRDQEEAEIRLRRALLAGFPDRVARRRRPGQPELVLVSGDAARLASSSVVHDAAYLVAADAGAPAGAGRGGIMVRLASAVDPVWLLDLPGNALVETDELSWNPETERVERVTRLAYGSVTLDESRCAAPSSPAAATLLARAARAAAWEADAIDTVVARIGCVAAHVPESGLSPLEPPAVDALLAAACADATSFSELRAYRIADRIVQELPPTAQRALRELAPLELVLPGGRRLLVHYPSGQSPYVASRLQDFFGMVHAPAICGGRVPVTLHLLAPNQRAVQVTSDLAGFWSRHYPAVRRELMRRYPKHAWPEDGATASPPPSRSRRKART